MTGLKRNLADKVATLLEDFPIVAVVGVRQCGKTTLSKQVCPNWRYMDCEQLSDINRIQSDPEFFFSQNPAHVIFDEAQSLPELFPLLRGIVDADRTQKGRFLLTGSSSPNLLKHISETLAGRVAVLELGTLKANEIYQKPLSPLYTLFQQSLSDDQLPQGAPLLTQNQIQTAWLRGGYPEPILYKNSDSYQQWMDQYRDAYLNRDIAKLFPRLNTITYQRFLSMLGHLSGTILNRSDLGRSLAVTEKTIRDYLTIADGTFIWRTLLSFESQTEKSLVKMPKGFVRDAGLLHHLLQIQTQEDLMGHPIIGRSFEGFVIEELLKGLQATTVTNWQAHYYRTRSGAEIDLILKGPFGMLPIEIKAGTRVPNRNLTHLKKFIQDHDLPFALLINQAEKAEWIAKGIFQLPFTYL